MPQLRPAAAVRVALALEGLAASRAAEIARVLETRGLDSDALELAQAVAGGAAVVGSALDQAPSPDRAAALAPLCRRAAEAGRPVVLLTALPPPPPARAVEEAATLAYLASHGAILCPDPDLWIETLILVAGHGIPAGPRVAIVAPPGTWLEASAHALTRELSAELRVPAPLRDAAKLGPADVALVDPTVADRAPDRVARALVVPVLSRAELLGDNRRHPLIGLRAALGAAVTAGRHGERHREGWGPAPRDAVAALEPDLERARRQLDNLGSRAGDHETKVLLSSYGVEVTRQAVAVTPSAATKVARKAGYPVEVKPWGPDQPSETEGCPVERDLATAADVRRAFAAVNKAAGQDSGAPVIVRAAPRPGRELRVRVARMGPLGWMLVAEVRGAPGPMAAPAPLRAGDAAAIADRVEASRAADADPDRGALADLLVRVSHLAVHHEELITELDLPRVIVYARGEGVVVADARARLHGPS